MYKLYGSPTSRAARVMWMLEEIGAPYEVIDAKPHCDAVLALNPSGKIPVLVDTDGGDDQAIFDSTAILLYLSEKHRQLTIPPGAPGRARMLSLVSFAVDDIEQPLWTMVKHGFTLPEEVRAPDAVRPACHYEFARAMQALEAYLGAGPYLMGEEFTVPDIIVGHLGGWAKATRFPVPEGRITEYMTRVRSRPAWRVVAKARAAA